jgi:hypothetical protein
MASGENEVGGERRTLTLSRRERGLAPAPFAPRPSPFAPRPSPLASSRPLATNSASASNPAAFLLFTSLFHRPPWIPDAPQGRQDAP